MHDYFLYKYNKIFILLIQKLYYTEKN